MCEWLLKRYVASKYNVCAYEQFKKMNFEDNAKPLFFNTSAHVSIYLQKPVEARYY